MAYEFMSLAEVEALPEVPENATVLAEVGGSIKRIPGNGLGGGKSLIITYNQPMDRDVVTDYGSYFSANMTFEEAFEAFNSHELAGASMYFPYNGAIMLLNIYLGDNSERVGMNCLVIADSLDLSGIMEESLYWLSTGFTTINPGRRPE